MPFEDITPNEAPGFTPLYGEPPKEPAPPTFTDTVSAAFHLGNDVLNFFDNVNKKPAYYHDDNFNLEQTLKDRGLWEDRDRYLGTANLAEFDYRMRKIQQERQYKSVIARSGWTGWLAGIAAGALSPTMFIPIVGEGRGLKAFATSTALAGLAAGAQEGVLQGTQLDRSTSEMVSNITMQTVLGGILGGTFKNLTPAEIQDLTSRMETPDESLPLARPIPTAEDPTPDFIYALKDRPGEMLKSYEFKNWFTGSKLADKNGTPLTMYHGSPAAFNEFKAGGFEGMQSGHGIYFTPDTTKASGYADKAGTGGSVYPVYLSVKNPFYIEAPSLAERARAKMGGTAAEVDLFNRYEGASAALTEQRIKDLKAQGYDGIVNRASNEVVVFDPNQIRSVFAPGKMIERLHPAIEKEVQSIAEQVARNKVPKAAAAGAEAVVRDDSGFYYGTGLGGQAARVVAQLAHVSLPMKAMLQQNFPSVRNIMGQLSNFGLKRAGITEGIVGSEGGTVEQLVRTWARLGYEGIKHHDEMFAKYQLGPNPKGPLRNLRADIAGWRSPKMSREEFMNAISEAQENGGIHSVPEVQEAAQYAMKNVYDPMFDAAVKAKVITQDQLRTFKSSKGYLNRIWDPAKVRANPEAFKQLITTHFITRLNAEFSKAWDKFVAKNAADDEAIRLMQLPPEEAIALRDKYLEDLKNLGKTPAEEQLSEAKAELRKLGEQKPKTPEAKQKLAEEKQAAREKIKTLSKDTGVPLRQAARKDLKRKISILNKTAAALGERRAAKLDRIDTLEERNLNDLERLTKKSQKVLNQLPNFSDKAHKAALRDLADDFARVGKLYDKGEEQIVKLQGDDLNKLFDVAEQQEKRSTKLTDIAEEMKNLEDVDPALSRILIEEANRDLAFKTEQILSRRSRQMERLSQQAKDLDPKLAEAYLEKLRAGKAARETILRERYRSTAEDIDLVTGKANFKDHVEGLAKQLFDKIGKTPGRLTWSSIIEKEERGPELARMLDIPWAEAKKFLETNHERLMRSYIHTLSGDIELTNKFGSVNPHEWGQWKDFQDEFNTRLKQIDQDFKDKKITEKQRLNRTSQIEKQRDQMERAIEATVSRIRHTYGLPSDPTSMAWRMGRIAMNLNVLRYMGGVTISSIPDVGRLIMKQGLANTFRTGFDALTTGFATMKLSLEEARIAGTALDMVLHSRAYAWSDLLDPVGRGTRFERGLEYATNKMGVIALFDYWTTAMKSWASAGTILQLNDAIEKFMVKGDKKALQTLAAYNLTGDLAERIWKQLDGPGSTIVNGRRYTQMENWTDDVAERAYSAALNGAIDDTIVTPGLERPLWMNGSLMGRLLGQFKSFGFASVSKTIIAGVQDRDANVLSGMMLSLALGAVSDYLWAVSSGGKTYEDWLAAPLEVKADRAISRSGLTAALDYLAEFAEHIPVKSATPGEPYSGKTLAQLLNLRLSPGRTARQGGQGDDLVGILGGPTLDLLEHSGAVLTNIENPTDSSVHKARQVLPYQNVTGIRSGLDLIEQYAKDVLVKHKGEQ